MAEATLDLKVELKNINKKMKELEKDSRKAGEKSGSNFSKGFGISAKKMAGFAAAAIAVVAGRASIRLAEKQEAAVNSLNVALKSAGDYSKQTSQDLQKFASDLQKVSTIGDETTLEMLAFTKSLGISNKMSKKVVSAAADMSAALGIDYKTAVQEAAKSLTGMKGRTFSMVGALKNLTTEQLIAGKGIEVMSRQFSGAASGKLNTFDGVVESLGNSWGDMLENVGMLITKSPALNKVILLVKKYIEDVSTKLSEWAKNGDIISVAVNNIAVFGKAVNMFLIAPMELAYNSVKIIFKGIVTMLNGAVAFIGDILGAFASVANHLGMDNEITKGLQNFAASSTEVLLQSANETKDAYENIFNFSTTDKIDTMLNKFKEVATVNDEVASSVSRSNEQISKSIAKTSKDFSNSAGAVIKVTKSQMATGLSNAMSAMGSALATGDDAMKAFAGSVLGTIGDISVGMGQNFIQQGIGIEALSFGLKTLSGASLIAAGVALSLFGGLFSGASKSLTGAATSAASGEVSSATSTVDSNIITSADNLTSSEDINKEPTTSIAVNIQGDVLDSDSTSLRIVDLLNDAFDQTGTTIRGVA